MQKLEIQKPEQLLQLVHDKYYSNSNYQSSEIHNILFDQAFEMAEKKGIDFQKAYEIVHAKYANAEKISHEIPLEYRHDVRSWVSRAETKEMEDAYKDYFANIKENISSGKSLIFVGKKGTGKTRLQTNILIEAQKKNFTIKWLSWDKVCSVLNGHWSNADNIKEMIDLAKSVDCLLLDDFYHPRLKINDDKEFFILEILRERTRWKRAILYNMILQTNEHTWEQVEARLNSLGSDIVDRIKANGTKIVVVNAESMRQ